MHNYSYWRLGTILGLCFFGFYFSIPSFVPEKTIKELRRISWLKNFIPYKKFQLGLDLSGGSQLLLSVDSKSAMEGKLSVTLNILRQKLRKNDISYKNLKLDNDTINIELFEHEDINKLKRIMNQLSQPDQFDIEIDELNVVYRLQDSFFKQTMADTIEQSITVLQDRVNAYGLTEPNIQRQGKDHVLIQVPGLQNPTELKKLIGKVAKLGVHYVREGDNTSDKETIVATYKRFDPNGTLIIEKNPIVTGDMVTDVSGTIDTRTSRPIINFQLNEIGAGLFGDATVEAHRNRDRLAFVLDNEVLTAPEIKGPIPGGVGFIEGFNTLEEAKSIANLIKSGSLPAKLTIVEERTVGPDLGSDSIEAGKIATIFAVLIVAVFMLIIYAFFGIIANIALTFNLIILMGALSILEATLTLPGIAGIALTLGMAVDANVLIFERIKEELRLGKTFRNALKLGYNRAMGTIWDSNITTLIGAWLLFYFGSGPIRGFAITLSLGIIISMFTAIYLTRLIAEFFYAKRLNEGQD